MHLLLKLKDKEKYKFMTSETLLVKLKSNKQNYVFTFS